MTKSQQETIDWLQRQQKKYLDAGLNPNQPDVFHLQAYYSINQLIDEVKNQTPAGRKFQQSM